MTDGSRITAFLVNANSRFGLEKLRQLMAYFVISSNDQLILQSTRVDQSLSMVHWLMEMSDNPLIVVLGGDGTIGRIASEIYCYGQLTGRRATLLPVRAGNKNDSYDCLYPGIEPSQLVKIAQSGCSRAIDLIEVTSSLGARHALGYAGIGANAVGSLAIEQWQNQNRALPLDQQLRQTRLREYRVIWNEVLRKLQPIAIQQGRSVRHLLNFSVHSIPRMSGELFVAPAADPTDGILEINEVTAGYWNRTKALLAAGSAKLGLSHCRELLRGEVESFTHARPLLLQLDGEVIELEPGEVKIRCLHQVLNIAA